MSTTQIPRSPQITGHRRPVSPSRPNSTRHDPSSSDSVSSDLATLFLDRVDGYRRRYEPAARGPSESADPSHSTSRRVAHAGHRGAAPEPQPTQLAVSQQNASNQESSECCDPSDAKELVVLVHGTFAGREADQGDSWWQEGSRTWQGLRARLPAGVAMPEQSEIFHWSGENSERARIKAGQELYERLLRLEASDRRYHLIGHSHGGSVIWHALRMATRRREPLDGLRTWSTVGTPFLHFRTHGALSLANILNLVLGILLLKPAYSAFVGFFHFAWAAIWGHDAAIRLRSDHEAGLLMALLRSPFLKVLEFAGVPVVETDNGLQLGTFRPC